MAGESKKSRKNSKPRTKRRQSSHVVGDIGVDIVRRKLPLQWVARSITPDYGLDLHVEVFEPDEDDPTSGNTLGEHLYVQVKTTKCVELERVIVRSRSNVTKHDPDPRSGEPVEIEVAKFSLDTEMLLTVETMGAAVPVLLCYVDLNAEKVYYICLNDYITKALLPSNSTYEGQDSVTVMIPSWNVLDPTDASIAYLWLLARRGKYYAAFNTFVYQFNELKLAQSELSNFAREDHLEMILPATEMLTMARTFLRSALRLSIWDPAGPGYWAPLGEVQAHLLYLQEHLPPAGRLLSAEEFSRYRDCLIDGFRRAANLGRMYEEIVREWRMPTALAVLVDFDEGNRYNPPRQL